MCIKSLPHKPFSNYFLFLKNILSFYKLFIHLSWKQFFQSDFKFVSLLCIFILFETFCKLSETSLSSLRKTQTLKLILSKPIILTLYKMSSFIYTLCKERRISSENCQTFVSLSLFLQKHTQSKCGINFYLSGDVIIQ